MNTIRNFGGVRLRLGKKERHKLRAEPQLSKTNNKTVCRAESFLIVGRKTAMKWQRRGTVYLALSYPITVSLWKVWTPPSAAIAQVSWRQEKVDVS